MVLCVCGERIQVPRSALGRTGLCPACGRVISITADSATPAKGPTPAKPAPVQQAAPFGASWNSGSGNAAPTEAKRHFAEAVDLYFSQKYAQALTIFETLADEYPDNADIVSGREMCMAALRNRQQMALEHQPNTQNQLPAPLDGAGTNAIRRLSPPSEPIPEDVVEDTLKHVLVEKMLNGKDDRIQLRAAELAIRVFGFGKKKPGDVDGEEKTEDTKDDAEPEAPEGEDPDAPPEEPAKEPEQDHA